MGAHHFTLYLIPPGATLVKDEQGRYEGAFLASFPLSDTVIQRLREIFSRTNHWGSVEEYLSDHEWGSDLRIYHTDSGGIDEVVFRFSPGADPIEKLQAFVAVAKDAACHLLVSSSGAVLVPEFGDVFAALRSHRAFRFLSDPEGAIIEAAQTIPENKGRGNDANS